MAARIFSEEQEVAAFFASELAGDIGIVARDNAIGTQLGGDHPIFLLDVTYDLSGRTDGRTADGPG